MEYNIKKDKHLPPYFVAMLQRYQQGDIQRFQKLTFRKRRKEKKNRYMYFVYDTTSDDMR